MKKIISIICRLFIFDKKRDDRGSAQCKYEKTEITKEDREQYQRTMLPIKDDLRKYLLLKRYFVRF